MPPQHATVKTWVAVVPALFFQVIGAYVYFVAFADTDAVVTVFTCIKISIFSWPLLWFALGVRPLLPRTHQHTAWLGVATGILAVICVSVAAFLFQGTLTSASPRILDMVQSYHIEQHYVLFAIFLSLVHSAFEEYYWRWFVFGSLAQQMHNIPAALISSVAFSTHHFIVLSVFFPAWFAVLGTVAVGLAGYVWCMLYARSGRLSASWISHALADAAVMIVGYFLLF